MIELNLLIKKEAWLFVMKKTLKYIMISILAAGILVIVKNQYSSLLLNDATYGMPALIQAGKVNNLFLGSSMFRQGVDINVLEAEYPEQNYILSYNGNQPVLEYFQLKKIVDQKVKIENLYVDMYAYSVWSTPDISDIKFLMELDLKDKITLWNVISKHNEDYGIEEFWRMFVNGNNEIILSWPLNEGLINSRFYKGGTIVKTAPSTVAELKNMKVHSIKGQMNAVQKEYLTKLIDLAKDNNINIVFIESPKYINVYQNEQYTDAMQVYAEFLEEKEIPFVLCEKTLLNIDMAENVLHYKFSNDKAKLYVDNGHLSYDGRVEFTEKIIEACNLDMD